MSPDDSPMRALLIGNGVNLLHGGGQTWPSLIATLASEAGLPFEKLPQEMPLPLVFEAVHAHRLITCPEYKQRQLKERVAELLNALRHNSYHKRLAELPVQHIITTNYDYCLEEALGVSEPRPCSGSWFEKKFSFRRRNEVSQRNFWHIHGEKNHPNSILLGHDHYAGYLSAARHALLGKTYDEDRKTAQMLEQVKQCERWIDVFLLADVDIVGFSFDFNESLLWWMLQFRLKFKYKYKQPTGHIRFHAFRNPMAREPSLKDAARDGLLKLFEVDVVEYPTQEWEVSYDQFLEWFA